MAQPEVDQIRDRLLALYVQTQAEIDARLLDLADTPSKASLRRRLRALSAGIDGAMAELDTAARAWVSRDLPAVYRAGATAPGLGDFQWTQQHKAAIQVLAGDTFDDLLGATRFLSRDTKRFVRQAARQHVRGAVVGGQTATQAGRGLAATLAERFGDLDLPAAVRYSNGARHSLGDFSDVILRTKVAETYNAGTLNQGKEAAVQWFEVFDGAACGWDAHGSADLANGTVRSAADCESHLLAHPRCARGFGARPDILSPEQAKAADRFDNAERQRLAEEERARAEVRTVTGRLTAAERSRRKAGSALARGRARRVSR